MKKRVLILIPIIIVSIIILRFLLNSFIYYLQITKAEKQLLNFYKLKSIEGLANDCQIDIDLFKDELPNEYNISKVINYYILQLTNIKQNNRESKNSDENLYVNGNSYYIQSSKNYTGYVNEDNIDMDYVINELKKVFIYRNGEWFINAESKDEYELQYGYYIKYKKIDFKKFDNIVDIIDVHFTEKVDFNTDEYKKKAYEINVKYVDKKNAIQINHRAAEYDYSTHLWSAGFTNLYYSKKTPAKIILGNHTYDKEKEEEQKRMDEEMAEDMRRYMEWEENLSDEERYFNPAAGN